MNTLRSIIVIDDDKDDQELLTLVVAELRIVNPVLFFDTGIEAIEYLKYTTETPLLIICDINMPGMNGMEVKQIIDEDEILSKKYIPFIFFSTASDQRLLVNAYQHLNIQGYFKKPNSFIDYTNTVRKIVNYWSVSCLAG